MTAARAVEIEDRAVVEAPIDAVWQAIADPTAHADWHPFVTEIAGEHRLGEVRSCSVLVGRKAGRTIERCVVEKPREELAWAIQEDSTGFGRMASDWTAGFRLEDLDGATAVTARSSFRPASPLLRLLLPLVRRRFHRTQKRILAGLEQSLRVPERSRLG
jgi:uncharacterized protein YndB with AHSA1/START domain